MDAIDVNSPTPGFYQCRLKAGGPFVACRIWWVRGEVDGAGEKLGDDILHCTVNGKPVDPYDWWPRLAKRPITARRFVTMEDQREWDRIHDPDAPSQNPERPIDWAAEPFPY
jgi:hypothetical protein